MLQRVLASLLCVLGAAAIGLGIASATLWRASDTLVASGSAAPGTTLLMTEPGVLDLAAGEVTVTASAEGGEQIVIALGRTADVEAWIGDDAHTRVTGLASWDVLSALDVAAVEQPAEGEAAPAEGEAAPGAPDPSGSDLWLAEVAGADEATMEWTRQDGRWSVLVATTGEGAGPATLTLTWPQVVTTPWLTPAVGGGSVLVLAGLVWWTLLLIRRRRPAPVLVTAGRVRSTAHTVPESAQESPVDVATGPLTRRAIRELEEAQRRRHERERTRSAFPVRIPGPGHGPDDQHPADGSGTHGVAPPESGNGTPPRGASHRSAVLEPVSDELVSDASGSGESVGGRARRESAVRWGRRPIVNPRLRRSRRDETGADAAGDAVVASPGATVFTSGGAPAGPPAVTGQASTTSSAWGQTVSGPTAAHQASASADAWRRAWGFPNASSTQDADAAGNHEGDDDQTGTTQGGHR